MPRGTKDGSRTHQPAVIDQDGSVLRPARILVRKHYTDLSGRSRQKIRIAFTEREADRIERKIYNEIDAELAGVKQSANSRTFAELAKWCQKHEQQPAEYVGETKVGGLRSWRSVKSLLKPIIAAFGAWPVGSISYEDLQNYKRRRLQSTTMRGTKRSKSSVQRELAQFKHMFNIAVREGWIIENPFGRGRPLIEGAVEHKRSRILSFDEESSLLAACVDKRQHLRLAILMAIETAMRQGEQMLLETSDVDLDGRLITVRARNSKTEKQRLVPITSRLMEELGPHMTARRNKREVFKYHESKRAFATCCELAGITDLHWHDLRHTAITRMIHVYKLPHLDVMKISGHQTWKTFFETYLNFDSLIVQGIGAQIDAARATEAERLETFPVSGADEAEFIPISEAVN